MRACTAVVTEISFNTSNDESAKYRAKIEFIKAEDWQRELEILLAEFQESNGTVYILIRISGALAYTLQDFS
tara:strand:+ start:810 stop:1025 length:216 start_codon:yes stop_codon:yes gene_type:complete